MKVLMLEDEAPAYRRLHGMLQTHFPEMEIVEVLDSVSGAIEWLRTESAPDLIFSDIQLSDGLSFEVFKECEPLSPVIFVTAHDEYMLEAFSTHGIDYLLKPVEVDRLLASVQKFKRLKDQFSRQQEQALRDLVNQIAPGKGAYRSRILIKAGSKLLPIDLDDVAYFRSIEGLCQVCLRNGKSYPLDESLDAVETWLDPKRFFRLNRQVIAEYRSIEQLQMHFNARLKVMLKPPCDEDVYVSRDKARILKNWLS